MPLQPDPPSGPPDQFLTRIGQVVVTSGWLERDLSGLYATLLESRIGPFVAAGQSFEALRTAALAVVEVVQDANQPLKESVKDVLGRAGQAWQKRNHVVHGDWQLEHHSVVERTVVRARQLRSANSRTFTMGQLDELVGELLVVAGEVRSVTETWKGRRDIVW